MGKPVIIDDAAFETCQSDAGFIARETDAILGLICEGISDVQPRI
jgi:hypothetical protein